MPGIKGLGCESSHCPVALEFKKEAVQGFVVQNGIIRDEEGNK